MRSLLYLESRVRARLESDLVDDVSADGDAAPRALTSLLSLFDPPNAVTFDGFSFLEFAVDGEDGAAALGAWFGRFGFAPAGRHRSKAAVLYRQGDIRLVVNAEPGSEARARFEEQGPTVCTLGLATPSPQQAADRGTGDRPRNEDRP